MSTATNVSVAKPGASGAIFRAPLGTTLPPSAKTALDAAFVELGHVSEDGITNTAEISSDAIKAWGGERVYVYQSEKTDEFGLTLIESLNADVLKAVYGDDNVDGTIATELSINVNADEQEEASWVIDMVLRGGYLKRIVIPDGKITETGEITYKDDEAVGYEITIAALPDTSSNTHYEYVAKPEATTPQGS